MIRDDFDILGLPDRQEKPRTKGLTHVLDKALSIRQVENMLDVAAEYIDVVKLGWGTAVITPNLEEKLDLYRAADIPFYFGGTLFEAFFLRDQLDVYRRLMDDLGVQSLEISDGSVSMAHDEKLELIADFSKDYQVLSEVGSKDANNIMPPYRWVEAMQAELNAGSWKVIAESRETGTAGLFRPNGEVRTGLVDEIVARVDPGKIIFEAPNKAQQVWFIKQLGANVNLGNIAPEEVIPVETLRLGLRGDTLFEFLTPGVTTHASGQPAGDGRSGA
ncbi:phosphosulfolactate synthase [Salisaeta longa]|uniref:phosphosulfolactate synthase n=1 Tax=Salisaeta longa TaxID=503170 RepID=UPI0003B4A8C5|nr:phosphosulfolactate synthase [Salisaeta longa]